MKKILSLVLAAMMIFSVLPAAFAAETAVAAEVSEDQVEAITLLNNLGIYKGYENGDMGADDLVQRYQMSIFATRFASGRTDDKIWVTTENDSGFTDIVDFAGAADYVTGMISYAAQRGIVNGTGDNKFEPTLYVKYKEAITMVVRALGQVYSAASYPWAYIQFANDNGLLDGIDTDIAPDDYVSRGVIAQLLYNALFVELEDEDGKLQDCVAEKNFGVGAATVMVTASNNVVYEPNATAVLNNGKIRFAEINSQGEPTGTDYHADAELFGLADAKAADKAVGTLYNVYYKNNFAGILSAESLAVVYENRGWDNMSVVPSDEKNYLNYKAYDAYVTIDGTKYQVVDSYTNLTRKQGPKSDAYGTAEMKVYLETGARVAMADLLPGYVLSSDGKYIYELGSNNSFFTPVAYYSEIINQWYTQDENGKWVIVPASTFFYGDSARVVGFGKQYDASAASAYANITVSANERMTIREYRLGQIDYDSATRVDMYGNVKGSVATFRIKYNDKAYTTGSMGAYDAPANYYLYGTELNTSEYLPAGYAVGERPVEGKYLFIDEYTWTGYQKSEIAEDSYILYYVNHSTREIEVIEIINAADDGDDTYTVAGYIRGFDIASNSLTFGDNYDTYYYDYDNLNGATIVSQAKNTEAYNDKLTSSNYTTLNYNVLSGKYNIPVTLVIVDGKVAHIATRGDNDFVVIDSFVSFEEDGIIANAWSTVANGYTQIKIKSFNGWTVGGIDYWYYFMSQYVGTASVYNLPFTTYELYKVVSSAGGEYDLTDAGSSLANKNLDLIVNKYGYIENVSSSGSWASTNYTAASDSHYWMILNLANTKTVIGADGQTTVVKDPVVYSLNGKINPVTFDKTAKFYKVKSNDYVIVINDADQMDALDFLSGEIAFYQYNPVVNQYDNQNYYVSDGFDSYNYTLLMYNVLTGKTEPVKLGNDSLLGYQGNYYNAYKMYETIKSKAGEIFKAEDGVITDVTATYDLSEVVDHYATKVPAYVAAGGYHNANVTGMKAVDIRTLVTKSMVANLKVNSGSATQASLASLYNSKVTFIYEWNNAFRSFSGSQADDKYTSGSWNSLYNSVVYDLNNLLSTTGNCYEAYWVINSDNETATVWIVDTDEAFAVDVATENAVFYYGDGVSSANKPDSAINTAIAYDVEVVHNEVADKVTVTVTIDAAAKMRMDVAKDTAKANLMMGTYNTTVNGTITSVATTYYLDKVVFEFANVEEIADGTLHIQINRDVTDPAGGTNARNGYDIRIELNIAG